MDALVSGEWLEQHLDDPDLRIIDATVQIDPAVGIESGHADWERSHIPGSVFADLLVDLSEPDPVVGFKMPPTERFAAAMSRIGVGEGTRVVVYDARENMWAARLWWMLRAFGFDDAAVLDGGWTSWTLEGRPTSTEQSSYPEANFVPRPRPQLIADKEEVLAAIDEDSVCILTTLTIALHLRPGRQPRRDF